jgi:hypothetical protein
VVGQRAKGRARVRGARVVRGKGFHGARRRQPDAARRGAIAARFTGIEEGKQPLQDGVRARSEHPPSEAAERFTRGLGRRRVGGIERREQRRHRPRVAEPAERPHRRDPDRGVRARRRRCQRLQGRGVADLAESAGGQVPDGRGRVVQLGGQGGHRAGVADLAQRPRRVLAHRRRHVVQRRHQLLDGERRAQIRQSLGGAATVRFSTGARQAARGQPRRHRTPRLAQLIQHVARRAAVGFPHAAQQEQTGEADQAGQGEQDLVVVQRHRPRGNDDRRERGHQRAAEDRRDAPDDAGDGREDGDVRAAGGRRREPEQQVELRQPDAGPEQARDQVEHDDDADIRPEGLWPGP